MASQTTAGSLKPLSSSAADAPQLSLPSLDRSLSRSSFLQNRSQRAEASQPSTAPLGRSNEQQRRRQQHQNEGDRTDALWAEMQATLAEVELSAARGTHFFGPEHSAQLEGLRNSQIALAQAWARGEAEEVAEHPNQSGASSSRSPGASVAGDPNGATEAAKVAENDILLAKKRREANDKYFWRVSKGVLDVVGKLEEVAAAMDKVEKESREMWSESESMNSGSMAS